jgi:polyphosphate kinase
MTSVARSRTHADSSKTLFERAWLDRDLSWLEFNRRVLHEAEDERTPLLERVKFLAIFTSNLDEFYIKRIGLLRGKIKAGIEDDPSSVAPAHRKRFHEIRTAILELLDAQARCYTDTIKPELERHGIVLAEWSDLTASQRNELSDYFRSNVSPALTPLTFDAAHPFPFMSSLSTNWAFVLRRPGGDNNQPVRVKSPTTLSQFAPLTADVPKGQRWFVSLEDLIRYDAPRLFPGMDIVSATLFRVFRNAEVDFEEEENETVRDAVIDALRERRFQPVVRIDFSPGADPQVRQALMERFELSEDDVYEVPGLIDYGDLFSIASLPIPELRDEPFVPIPPALFAAEDANVFDIIRAGDVLVHHPYDSFDATVERFIDQAADDPATVSIKMTVYRVGDDTPFVRSLIRAAEAGKQVACVVEIKARFDEERNLLWARELERVGAHVTYGVVGLKTHTKLALVVRQEAGELRCYAHVGTGNYHVKTAKLYTDVGLFTADRGITSDAVNLFHYFTGLSLTPQFDRLLVAPTNMRDRFIALIKREEEHQRAGRPARIIAKMNQLEDVDICHALAAASASGVQIDLIVRGLCCLRPGVRALTENIRVRSIIGRFLEHSRVFYFANGSDDPLSGDYFIGSADWMFRNLSLRVEAVAPVAERGLRQRLWEILDACLSDDRQAWTLQTDGTYAQGQAAESAEGPAAMGAQAWLIDTSRRRARELNVRGGGARKTKRRVRKLPTRR